MGLAYQTGDYEKASRAYSDALKENPKHSLAAEAYLRLGQCYRRLGKWGLSKDCLSRVIRSFPDSFERKEAEKELKREFYFYLQLGSFGKYDNAQKLIKKLKRQGFNPYIEKMIDEKTFYRVRIGKFDTKEPVLDMAQKLKAKGYKYEIYP